jgi:hypothetical protein
MHASKTAATKIEKVIPVAPQSHHDGFTLASPAGFVPSSFPRILVRENPISATKRAQVISEIRANIVRAQVEAIRSDKAAYLASLGY